jgi:hypothetical protein
LPATLPTPLRPIIRVMLSSTVVVKLEPRGGLLTVLSLGIPEDTGSRLRRTQMVGRLWKA